MDQEILDMTVILTGAAEDRQMLLTALCTAARQRWQARLREGVTVEDCGQAFVCAAAFSAAADFLTGEGGSAAASSFAAGEISVSTSSASGRSACAQALRGKPIWIDRHKARLEDGSVFIADLIGLRVLAEGAELGTVSEVLSLPANDVYVVTGQEQYMIPAVKEFIKEINVSQGYMEVTLLEGMRTDEN